MTRQQPSKTKVQSSPGHRGVGPLRREVMVRAKRGPTQGSSDGGNAAARDFRRKS